MPTRHAVGVVPGAHQGIAGGFAGRIGLRGGVGDGFREPSGGPKGAGHLIGADVVQPEAGLALGWVGLPLASHRLEQLEGAAHVALDEGAIPIDRVVHMVFGRQVQHQIGIDLQHSLRRGCRIRKVNMQ